MKRVDVQDLLILIISTCLVVCFVVIFVSGRMERSREGRISDYLQCKKDSACKGDRVCDGGVCVYPRKSFVPYGFRLNEGVSENK